MKHLQTQKEHPHVPEVDSSADDQTQSFSSDTSNQELEVEREDKPEKIP